MAFKFSLATVLRVRGLVEDREERMLQQIVQEISQTMQAVEESELGIRRSNAQREDWVLESSTAMDVGASYGEWEQRKLDRQGLEAHLNKLENLRAVQMKVYAAARREREMLTDMRAEKRDVYDIGVARREQSAMDDNFNARRGLVS